MAAAHAARGAQAPGRVDTAAVAERAREAQRPRDTIADLIERQMPAIKRALPRHMTPERLARVALTTIRLTPGLAECSAVSLVAAIMQAAQLGLEPGLLGQCYLIPRKGQATFQIGYRGLLELVRRSGDVTTFDARVVHANDHFELELGLEQKLVHRPCLDGDPGPMVAAYAIARLKDGGYQMDVMTRAEILAIRKRSAAVAAGRSSPWDTDEAEMWRKTVAKRLCKYLPLAIELQRAIAQDETAKSELLPDMTETVDSTAYDVEGDQDPPDAAAESAGDAPAAAPEVPALAPDATPALFGGGAS